MKRLPTIYKVTGVVLIVAISLLLIQIISLNHQLNKIQKERDGELIEKYNSLQDEFDLLQSERDSLKKERSLWMNERSELILKNVELDSLWSIKQSHYEETYNNVVRDGTVVDIANFLTNH